MIDKLGKAILTMFGIGYFRYAPGTAASFVTITVLGANNTAGSVRVDIEYFLVV